SVQKRSTLASSSGASTSSSTQIGAGLVRKTAKSKASAVSACSPPESSDMICSRLPGGLARISSPASSGSRVSSPSSPRSSVRWARPPPKSRVKSRVKCSFTSVKAASSRSRPSRFKAEMPSRSLAIAPVRSSRSRLSAPSFSSISVASASATRLTGPMPSRSRTRRCSLASASSVAGSSSPSSTPPVASTASGAHALLARLRQRRIGGLARLFRFGKPRLARRQRVARGVPPLGRAGDALGELLALLGDFGGTAIEPLALLADLGAASLDGGVLARRRLGAARPGLRFGGDGGDALGARRCLPQQPVMLGLRCRLDGAPLGELGAQPVGFLAAERGIGQLGEPFGRLARPRLGFGEIGGETLGRLGQSCQPRGGGGGAPLQLGVAFLGAAQCRERIAHRLALGALGLAGLARAALDLLELGRARREIAFDGAQLLTELGGAGALAQPLPGRGRRAGGTAEAVPAPEPAIAGDE